MPDDAVVNLERQDEQSDVMLEYQVVIDNSNQLLSANKWTNSPPPKPVAQNCVVVTLLHFNDLLFYFGHSFLRLDQIRRPYLINSGALGNCLTLGGP